MRQGREKAENQMNAEQDLCDVDPAHCQIDRATGEHVDPITGDRSATHQPIVIGCDRCGHETMRSEWPGWCPACGNNFV